MNHTGLDGCDFGDLLLETSSDWNGKLHERIERECWKQHGVDFEHCREPACLLVKGIANLLGWKVGVNGVLPPDDAGRS